MSDSGKMSAVSAMSEVSAANKTSAASENIADRPGCSRSNIVSAMKSHGLERRKLIISESMMKKLRV